MFAGFLFLLTVLVDKGFGSNRCKKKGYIELYNRQNRNEYRCWPPPECHDGQEPSVEPGSSHPIGTDISCQSCKIGFFSNNRTNNRCHKCTSCGKKQELYPCTLVKDRECANKCISNKYYFNDTEEECYRCVECCEGDDENIEPQCIALRKGVVIGGKGEKHCKISNRRCDDLPTTSSEGCTCNCSVSNNSSIAVGNSPAMNISSTLQSDSSSLHKPCAVEMFWIIALSCSLVVAVALILVYFLYWRRKWSQQSNNLHTHETSSRSCIFTCSPLCISDSSTCTGSSCCEEVIAFMPCQDKLKVIPGSSCCEEVIAFMPCQDKLKVIPEVQIDEVPYDVEVVLIQKLDAKKTNAKNWWDVGRKIGISRSQLENVDQGESPTKTIISILSTWHDVPTIRKFVEIADKLGRHDICKNVVEFYQNQTPEIVNETPA